MQRGMGGRPMTDQFNDGLDFGQSMALLNEAQSAQNLLRDTVGAIVRLRHPIVHGDSVFTLGSIGVEKLMKIVLGLVHLRGSGTWPTVKVMKSWGHGVLEMDALVASTLEANMAASTTQTIRREASQSASSGSALAAPVGGLRPIRTVGTVLLSRSHRSRATRQVGGPRRILEPT